MPGVRIGTEVLELTVDDEEDMGELVGVDRR